ncbi:hypothetical protein D187_008111 [Cystobacter fuscus DSM 2262]|uniref:Protein kinase n=1 Tax=Cystobacter fuscus (strain ATCC 25194 / DSM 2262 / NBRC 100088 / M29) TaxID=1242864 RepID=S9NY81_CYSF2|nr:hypothetical protein [Cystobacter fuscus]EPX55856.1 hypothetical protein D187_008111 [Cystobacter fuscus DSM 2262]
MSDTSKWKGGRIGLYEIGGRCQDLPEDAGEIYEARHVETGAPALALRPGPGMNWRPRSSWDVLTTHVLQPDLLIVHPRWPSDARAPSFHELSLAYIHIAGALALLAERRGEGSSFVAQTPMPSRTRRRAVRWGLAGAGVALTVGLALLLWPRAPEHSPARNPLGESPSFTDGKDLSTGAIAYPMPEKPFSEQRKPPCMPELEVEIRGGCWVQAAQTAPCPRGSAEYQGKCYVAVKKPDPVPRSVQP